MSDVPKCQELSIQLCDVTDTRTDDESALGHDMGAWAIVTEPTFDAEGEARRDCEREDCDYYETIELPILDKESGEYEYELVKAPTCTEDGLETYTYVVSVQNDEEIEKDEPAGDIVEPRTVEEEASDTIVIEVVLPKLGHNMGNWYTVKYPTVRENGLDRRDCTRCDYYELFETAKREVQPNVPERASVNVKYLNTADHLAYIIGYADGTIKPQGNITRAEIVTIYFRLMDDETRENFWSTENGFADVNENNWFNLAVSTLNKAGVIVDVKDGNVRPNDPITRAELAVMAAQFCTVIGKLPNAVFTDVDKGYWAAEEIALIKYAGWIEGYPDGTFRPDNTITRAEAMTIINRMLGRAVEDEGMLEGMLTFVDVSVNAWYFEAVQEASNSHNYVRTDVEVADYGYNYEIWTVLLESPNWAAIEKAWSEAR